MNNIQKKIINQSIMIGILIILTDILLQTRDFNAPVLSIITIPNLIILSFIIIKTYPKDNKEKQEIYELVFPKFYYFILFAAILFLVFAIVLYFS